MDILDVQENLRQLNLIESQETIHFLGNRLGVHKSVLDMSNKYILDETVKSIAVQIRKQSSIKTLTFQNCMLTAASARKLFKVLSQGRLSIQKLDIGNNRFRLTEALAASLALFLDKGGRSKAKSLNLQGNVISNAQALRKLLQCDSAFSELNLYDTCLSEEALEILTEFLSENRAFTRLDLAYNDQAFVNPELLSNFAMGVSLNHHLEYLNLSGNSTLKAPRTLVKLFTGLQMNTSLQELNLGSIGFGNTGTNLICKLLFPKVPLGALLLENNNITTNGFAKLLQSLPPFLWKLDISYNRLTKSSILETMGETLQKARSLRHLNISYSLEIAALHKQHLVFFCDGVRENISLTDFVCEGAKIGDDPDYFCNAIGEAISARKLSLTFKISAVNCFSSTVSHMTSFGSINKKLFKSTSFNSLPKSSFMTPSV